LIIKCTDFISVPVTDVEWATPDGNELMLHRRRAPQ